MRKEEDVRALIKKLLDEKFGENESHEEYCLYYIIHEWDDQDLFKKGEYLLSLNDKNIYNYLWNSVPIYKMWHYDEFVGLDKKDYPSLVLDLLNKRVDAFYKVENKLINPKQRLDSNRLILRTAKDKDLKIIDKAYRTEGSFFMEYCHNKNTKKNRDIYLNNIRSSFNYFVIEEKESKSTVGYIAMNIEGKDGIGKLEYYILKAFRGKGYCKEACTCIINAAFNNKLLGCKKTEYEDVYKISKRKVNIIKANCFDANVGSNAVLKSLGFTYSGYNYKGISCDGGKNITENLYYLEKKDWYK